MRLISFLGTGDYKETTYHWGDAKDLKTPFVILALASFLEADEVRVLATQAAQEKHGIALREAFSGAGPDMRLVEIPDGRDESELWSQFDTLRKALEEGTPERVAVDITHGFRAQPFFAAAAIALLRSVRGPDVPVEVYYGEYRKDAADSPIWDLSLFVELLDWAHGAGVFMRTGFAGDLLKVMGERDRAVRRRLARSGERINTRQMVKALNDFAADLATVRVASLITGYSQDSRARDRARATSARLLEAIEDCREDVKAHLPPLAAILDDLAEKVRPLHSDRLYGEGGQEAMQELAELYLQWERYPEAAIVAREAAVSRYAQGPEGVEVNSCGFDEQARRSAEQRWCKKVGAEARTVGEVRNDIEHGGFRRQPLPAKALQKRIGDLIGSLAATEPPERASERGGGTYFVSRHPGAREWARRQDIQVDEFITHLDVERIGEGDTVIGSLPVNLAVEVCSRGASYLHLSLELPPELRGRELTADDLQALGARIEPFLIQRLAPDKKEGAVPA